MDYFGHSIVNGFRSHKPAGLYDARKGHTGIDIAMPIGTEISLPMDTRVGAVHEQNEMGLTLFLEDTDGNVWVFAHLSEVLFSKGSIVQANQVFARSGNSGTATTGPHLHLEIIALKPTVGLEFMTRTLQEFRGFNVDPIPYLEALFTEHWAQDALDWARQHQIITQDHHPDEPMTWGQMAVTMKRLAEKILEWNKKE